MKIVIQCAGKKRAGPPGSGLRRPQDGLPVKFVARPDLAPPSASLAYARPDDLYDASRTWRQMLLDYNRDHSGNPSCLAKAHQLYLPGAYEALVSRFGEDKVFILSAGWGLIPADFLTPDYDITFSVAKNVELHARRAKSERGYADFQMLPDDGEDIVFLGGQDYLPLFRDLTHRLKAQKKVFFNTSVVPRLGERFGVERFPTKIRTNWHYTCAQMLADGSLK